MRFAVLSMGVAALSLGMLVATAAAKAPRFDHSTHTGTFVSATAAKLVMTDAKGKEHSHAMAKKFTVMIDGKPGELSGLHKGMQVSVTTDKGGAVTAVSTVAVKPAATTPVATTKPASTTPAAPPKGK